MRPISDCHYIANELRQAKGERLAVLNPATGEPLGSIGEATAAEVGEAVEAAAAAFGSWAGTPPRRRGQLLAALAVALRQNAEELAELDTHDSGRTLPETRGQVERSAQQLEYCAGLADKLEGRVVPMGRSILALTHLEPYGVVGALTPWNAPLLQIAQKASHALVTGNTIVVKPSPLACFTALEFARLAGKVGLPPGVLNVVTGGAAAGRCLVEDNRVSKVTFTGSVQTGRQIASACAARGAAVSLELGGKCPLIVYADADLPKAATEAARASFAGAGQSCVAAARILVEAECFAEFTKLFSAAARGYVGADPKIAGTVMGPLISAAARERVAGLVADAVSCGATLLQGDQIGSKLGQGYFYDAITLLDVPSHARITTEEVFGPVACLERFSGEGQAIALANAGPYGLAAGVFSRNTGRARRMSAALDAGNVWINCYKHLDPALPFGGDKSSGLGRECGIDGVMSFVKPKTVVEVFDPT
jgi:acyl-CoA reductase-like NAD-dependent aldehyde dehydrogenase